MNTKAKIYWVTRTAIFLAIALIAQLIGQAFGGPGIGQILTGSLVNMALIITGLTVGLSAGCTIAVLSPCMAFLFGMMKFAPTIPVVILGNVIVVVITYLFFKKLIKPNSEMLFQRLIMITGVIVGAGAKCLFMWLSATVFMPAIGIPVPAPIVAMFSLPQAITATIGGIIAMLIFPILEKSKNNKA